jgi:hypothetical protein
VVIDEPTAPGLWPIHGDGVLARYGDVVLLVHPAGGAFTDRLLDRLADADQTGADGKRSVDLISAECDADAAAAGTAGGEPGPAVAAFGPDGGGTVVAVYGTAWVEVTTAHGAALLTPGQPYGRLRCVLPSRPSKIRAGVRAGDVDGGTDRYLRLVGGIVRAVALVYVPESGPGVPAAGPAEEEEPADPGTGAEAVAAGDADEPEAAANSDADAAPFIAVYLGEGAGDEDAPLRKALPLGSEPPDEAELAAGEPARPEVTGVYCKNRHFNDPEARYCAVCGIGMAQLTKVPQAGLRPPLGVLVLDDGSVFQLDADYVIGREPSLDASVASGSARPLRIAGTSGLVSRIHARVELDGWQVFVCDLNSANGTSIRLPGQDNSTRLPPGVRTPLVVGAQVHLGSDFGFRYDSHRHR